IAVLDADDLWSPRRLELQLGFLESHPEAALSFSWSRVLDEDSIDTRLTSSQWEGPIPFSELLFDSTIAPGSAAMMSIKPIAAAGGIDTTLPGYYDLALALGVALLRRGNVWAIPEFLTFERRRAGQISSNLPRMGRPLHRILGKLGKRAPEAVGGLEAEARA